MFEKIKGFFNKKRKRKINPETTNVLYNINRQFTVDIKCGDVFVDGRQISQLCWDPNSIGYAIAYWLETGMSVYDD